MQVRLAHAHRHTSRLRKVHAHTTHAILSRHSATLNWNFARGQRFSNAILFVSEGQSRPQANLGQVSDQSVVRQF